MTQDQIDELRELQKELRAQAEVVSDAWHNWVDGWDDVSTALDKYNELLKEARDLTGDPMGELDDYETMRDDPEFALDEAAAIDDIIEEDALLCPECKSGPGEEHSIHCSLEHGP